MKRLYLAAITFSVAAPTAAVLTAVGLLFTSGASGSDTIALTVVSQTSSTITLGWTPQPGYGYLFSTKATTDADWKLVSRTNDPSRSSAKFSKTYAYQVAVIAKGNTGTYPPPLPPPSSCAKYAAPSGSDGNVGTQAAPYLTVQKLVTSLTAGQTGCLLPGSYTGSVTFTNGGITIVGPATILGYVWVKATADDVTLHDLKIDGYAVSPPTVQVHGDRVTLDNLEITNRDKPGTAYNGMCVLAGSGFEATPANTAVDLTVSRSRIHNCGDDAHEHAIYLESTRNAHVVDSFLYDNPGYGIHMYPDAQGSLIENDTIDGNSSKCKANVTFSGEKAGGEYSQPHGSSHNVIRNSLITNSLCRYNVESYYPNGALQPTGNVVENSCVWNAPWGNYGYLKTSAGNVAYAQHDNLDADPQYIDRTAKNFALQPTSPCLGKGAIQ